MPIKSQKEYGLMQVAAHNPSKLRGKGPSPEVAEEMIHKTPPAKRKLFAKRLKNG